MSHLWNGPFGSKEIAQVVSILSSLCLFLTIMLKGNATNHLVPFFFFKKKHSFLRGMIFEGGAMIKFTNSKLLLFVVISSPILKKGILFNSLGH